jgi:glycosyltransferase involved in cell wall biosynthesis
MTTVDRHGGRRADERGSVAFDGMTPKASRRVNEGEVTHCVNTLTKTEQVARGLERTSIGLAATIGMVRPVSEDGTRRHQFAPIAYLTVLYPATSHTFIHREVAGLRSRGIPVRTYSLNGVDPSTLLTDFELQECADTVQIKALAKRRLVSAMCKQATRHPRALLGTIRAAMNGRGLDLGAHIKAVLQVGEALVLFDDCDRHGISHVHAHFGQAPANVAWFATEFAHRIGRLEWSFSYTIHGPQDCLTENDRTLGRKVRAAQVVISVSDYTAAQLIRRIDIGLWDKVRVVRCGVDIARDDHRGPAPERDVATVLMVGRISPEKGHVVAVSALGELRARGISARLRLVGPGNPDDIVLPAARRLGVEDLVDCIGRLDPAGVAAEFERATVFALPSFAEGLPIVIMESMAHGCPVVASGISGIPELVDHGVTGLLVPPARADLLADALELLLSKPDARQRMADAGRQRVARMHEGTRQLDELVETLESTGCLDATGHGHGTVEGSATL